MNPVVPRGTTLPCTGCGTLYRTSTLLQHTCPLCRTFGYPEDRHTLDGHGAYVLDLLWCELLTLTGQESVHVQDPYS